MGALSLAPEVRTFGRYQLGSVLATAIDWAAMIACVELLHIDPVSAAAIGPTAGGVVGFVVGRRWVFRAPGDLRRQAIAYFLVWIVGTALNAGGEKLLLPMAGHYLLARFVIATAVGIGWNYQMGRRFVFREATQ